MVKANLKDKIEKLYNENNINPLDCQNSHIRIKNVVTNMIKQHYEWEEIKTIMGILRKGKGQDLIDIIKETID